MTRKIAWLSRIHISKRTKSNKKVDDWLDNRRRHPEQRIDVVSEKKMIPSIITSNFNPNWIKIVTDWDSVFERWDVKVMLKKLQEKGEKK